MKSFTNLKTIDDIMYIVDGIRGCGGLGYKPYYIKGGTIENDITYEEMEKGDDDDDDKISYITGLEKHIEEINKEISELFIEGKDWNKLEKLEKIKNEELIPILEILKNADKFDYDDIKSLLDLKENIDDEAKNIKAKSHYDKGLLSKALEEFKKHTELSKEEKLRIKELEVKSRHDKGLLSKTFKGLKKLTEMSEKAGQQRIDDIKNIRKERKKQIKANNYKSFEDETTGKKITKDYGFGDAYEDYTYRNRDKDRYAFSLGKDFKNLKYETNPSSIYDAYYTVYDNNGNVISVNANEDKNYKIEPTGDLTGCDVSKKESSNFFKEKYNNNYDNMKDELQVLINTKPYVKKEEMIETVDKIDDIFDNAGVKVQFSKFQGQDYKQIPLITHDRKLYGIYNKDTGELEKKDMNGDIDIKAHLREGEFLYNPLKDDNMILKKAKKIDGVQYYVLDPSYYINDKMKNTALDIYYVYIPVDKFKRKILNL